MAGNATNTWYRAYHGMVSDDKWPLVARKSGQNIAAVVAVWCALLECASQAKERGSIEDFDPESMDVLLGLDEGACQQILDALQSGKSPRIIDNKLANWNKRQPKRDRVDTNSTQRVREYRDRQKNNGVTPDVTPCNASETPRDDNETPETGDETPRNAYIREEKRREDIDSLSLPTERELIDFGLNEVKSARLQMMPQDAEDAAKLFFAEVSGRGWVDGRGLPIQDWRQAFRAWSMRYAANLAPPTHKYSHGTPKPSRGARRDNSDLNIPML